MNAAPVRTVEVRTLELVPGRSVEFIRLYRAEVLPLSRRWAIDVVAFGLSLEAGNAYVIRAFKDPEHRQQTETAFYSSPEWREGPRDAILGCLERYTDVVFLLDAAAVEVLRRSLHSPD